MNQRYDPASCGLVPRHPFYVAWRWHTASDGMSGTFRNPYLLHSPRPGGVGITFFKSFANLIFLRSGKERIKQGLILDLRRPQNRSQLTIEDNRLPTTNRNGLSSISKRWKFLFHCFYNRRTTSVDHVGLVAPNCLHTLNKRFPRTCNLPLITYRYRYNACGI